MFQFMEIFGDVMRIVTFQRQSEALSQPHEGSEPRRVSSKRRREQSFRR